ncbi:hypothetical protein BX592_103307 [Paraburkholderia rhizosphaerae]|uniref:Uncharacterized protein n=1 Tax=Paraburkholderia rhizosphaerae TaxID=480658 RepID=A0A4R8LYP8_9BURK|nr:hypothetical protein BX592_103307 [Paraburkholderia rhizosphaerae]
MEAKNSRKSGLMRMNHRLGKPLTLNGWKRASILRTLRQYDSHVPVFKPIQPSGL